MKVGNIEIDNERRRVIRAGQEVQLTPKEFEILVLLARRAGAVVRHKQMLTAIWGPAHVDDTPYLRVHIAQLRRKIEDNPEDPKIVLNVPGIGYRIAEST